MDLERNQLGLIGKPGLLLIDMIEGFTDPACPLGSESDRAVGAASQLLALFRQQQWPVFYYCLVSRPFSGACLSPACAGSQCAHPRFALGAG